VRDHVDGSSEDVPGFPFMSLTEKLMCEWEARHDVAARGRQADPAAALHRYLTHTRIEEHQHQPHPAHRSATSRDGRADGFTSSHPLAASWLRWGEDSP
jgi:hypothetical protein